MLHPFMPFVTEELWSKQGERPDYPLITARWPEPQAEVDADAKVEIEFMIEFVGAIRSLRAEYQIPWSQKLIVHIAEPDKQNERILFANAKTFIRMTRCHIARFGSTPEEMDEDAIYVTVDDNNRSMAMDGRGIQFFVASQTYLLLVEGVIDIDAEKTRLAKALDASAKEAKSLEGRLGNAKFVERAAPQAVEKARADHAHHVAEIERLEAALARLG